MRFLVFLVVLSLLLTCTTVVLAKEYVSGGDNFESYPVNTIFRGILPVPPDGFNDTWGDSALYQSELRYDQVQSEEGAVPANQVCRIVDTADTTTKNMHLRADFWPAGTTYVKTGVYAVQMDVKPMTDTSVFKIVVTRGGAWTSGTDWLCALGFGKNAASPSTFMSGLTAGAHLGLQWKNIPGTPAVPNWTDAPSFPYTAGTWYTAKFVIDVNLKRYQVFFGPRGGTLAEVTNGPTTWIVGAATMPTSFGGMYVATSNVANEGADVMLDNVSETEVPVDRSDWIVWDSFHRAGLGTTEDANHYPWVNTYYGVPAMTNSEMVLPAIQNSSDGPFIDTFTPANLDISMRVRSSESPGTADNGAGIGYRALTRLTGIQEAGNPGFGYRLFWPQNGTSIELAYRWFGAAQNTTTYTPPSPIDWTVPHSLRVKAIGLNHKVWLDGTQIIDWTDSEHINYATVAARNVSNTDGGDIILYRVYSEYHIDDFVMQDVSTSVSSAAAAKALEIGTSVVLSGSDMCVSYAYPDIGFFYLEDLNRVAGIKVVSPAVVTVGNLVTVTGTVKSADGEKYIDATSAMPDTSALEIKPYGMNNKAHGLESKLPNIGLLSRVWGVVTWVNPDLTDFYVDDGSGFSYVTGKTGIKVYTDGGVPGQGDYVACTGVASMDPGAIPVIRMRESWIDMDIIKRAPL